MKIVPLKCPNCSGEIQLDASNEIGTCSYCGGKILLQKEFASRTEKERRASKIRKPKRKIKFVWKSQLLVMNPEISIIINDEFVLSIENGQAREIDLYDGRYNILFKHGNMEYETVMNVDDDSTIEMRWNGVDREMVFRQI